MKRTEFKPRAPQRKDRDPDRLRSVPTVTPGAFRAPQPVGAPVAPIEKETPLRSEAYRRAMASLPCAYCGIEGYSQHAHENDGKGARLKVDDRRAMPLCCSRPGIDGYAEAQAAKAERAEEKKARAAAKVERAETRRRNEAIKTIPDLIKEAQREFNAYIRARDQYKPCICCGRPLGDGDVGGAFDAGHYRSTGSASHLRFHEHNCHAQRKQCNRYGAGRAVDYRIGLIGRIGLEAVEALEADNTPHKWTREELISIRNDYRAKLKECRK